MVKPYLIALGLATLSLVAWAEIRVQVDKRQLALGEPLTIHLSAPPGALARLNLAPLAQVVEIYAQSQSHNDREDSMELVVYPRRTGSYPLAHLGLPAHAPHITVQDETPTIPKVRLRAWTEPARFYARQTVRLTLETCDDNSLLWTRPVMAMSESILSRPLGETPVTTTVIDGQRCHAHRWHWAITPTVAGALTLPLPMLEASVFGKRLRYAPPTTHLIAQPVPAWLPPETPVGRVTVRPEALPHAWAVERPVAWRIAVTGDYSVLALQHLLAIQLRGSPLFAHYPPTVLQQEDHLQVTLYAVPTRLGTIATPALAFPYYDPQRGQLVTVRLKAQHIRVVNPLHAQLILAAQGIAGVLGFFAVMWSLYRLTRWRRARWHSLRRVRAARDLASLTEAVCAFALAPHAAPATQGLHAWQAKMQQHRLGPDLTPLVTAINHARYSPAPEAIPFTAVRQLAIQVLRAQRPR
ncbi:MAG: hypothetical protein D4R70_00010 [Betaproteobacteria bacterium]|nr:MAG: hypothetical protein D4R70_00010 [Betaproteobacteria bacterium]